MVVVFVCLFEVKYFGLYLRSNGKTLKILSRAITMSDFPLTKIMLAPLCRHNWRRDQETVVERPVVG